MQVTVVMYNDESMVFRAHFPYWLSWAVLVGDEADNVAKRTRNSAQVWERESARDRDGYTESITRCTPLLFTEHVVLCLTEDGVSLTEDGVSHVFLTHALPHTHIMRPALFVLRTASRTQD
jgi:hypothetical protein